MCDMYHSHEATQIRGFLGLWGQTQIIGSSEQIILKFRVIEAKIRVFYQQTSSPRATNESSLEFREITGIIYVIYVCVAASLKSLPNYRPSPLLPPDNEPPQLPNQCRTPVFPLSPQVDDQVSSRC